MRSSKIINQTVFLTCLKPSKNVDHTLFQLLTLAWKAPHLLPWGRVSLRIPHPHSVPATCVSLCSGNTLSVIIPLRLCTCTALFLESSIKSSSGWLLPVTKVLREISPLPTSLLIVPPLTRFPESLSLQGYFHDTYRSLKVPFPFYRNFGFIYLFGYCRSLPSRI